MQLADDRLNKNAKRKFNLSNMILVNSFFFFRLLSFPYFISNILIKEQAFYIWRFFFSFYSNKRMDSIVVFIHHWFFYIYVYKIYRDFLSSSINVRWCICNFALRSCKFLLLKKNKKKTLSRHVIPFFLFQIYH